MEDRILNILEDICEDEIIREDLDINLLDNGLMDSLDYTTLLVELEAEFDIVIAPSEYTREQSDTPAKIIAIVEEKVNR